MISRVVNTEKEHPMKWIHGLIVAGLIVALLATPAARAAGAKEILGTAGVTGGLVVHLGCGEAGLTAGLRANAGTIVQGLDTDAANVAKVRARAKALGVGGKVSAAVFDGKLLPYTDNLVSLLVVSDAFSVSQAEMRRVVAPGGTIYTVTGAKATVKPRPKTIDEWTHYLHGPGNNAVARDTVVGPPRHVQWLAGPRWTRNHHKLNSISSVVTANGRLFTIVDRATAANMSIPGKWAIVARDAFNGVTLWTKPLPSWTVHTVRFRSGPPQVTRLLVVDGDRLYAPLGLSKPVSQLDAVTGKTLRTFAETAGAEEIVLAGNKTLLALTGSPVAAHAAGHPEFKGKPSAPITKTIVAADVETGRTLWKWKADGPVMPETLGADDKHAYVQIAQGVACLNLKSGKVAWRHGAKPAPAGGATGKKKAPARRRRSSGYGKSTLVVADGVVLCNLSGKLTAIDGANGKKLWDAPGGQGFHAPMDVFVIDQVVWTGSHPSDSVSPPPVKDFSAGRDLRTGKIVKTNTIAVDLQTSGHHHRCYREKATVRYIITGKRGLELMDMTGEAHARANWVRGTCQYGMLPANGLTYAPPHSCGCYMESKLWGFYAMASDRPVISAAQREVPPAKRLVKGPAYGKTGNGGTGAESWPQYRRDVRRSGVAATRLPGALAPSWTADLGGKLTQPVAAGGKVVVASTDAHTVIALDEKTGKVAWQYVAGGRIDSPPALHKGLVLFGSADGWVTCLRLSDGAEVWRFLAAPADIRIVAMDRVESVWPVHGSVLVLDDVAYCSAGRSTWLDGGIALYGLDPATGRVVCSSRFASRHPKLKEGKTGAKPAHKTRVSQNTTDYKTFLQPDKADSFSMAGGSVNDVLTSNGRDVFMHHARFDAKLAPQDVMARHLFSTSGLLDDAENHRSHWVLGTGDFSRVPVAYSWIANSGGRWGTALAVPYGVMLVFDETAAWTVRRKGTGGSYSLLQRPNTPFSAGEKFLPDFRKPSKDDAPKWTVALPVRPRAMLKAGDKLVLGCMPTAPISGDPHAPYEGRGKGVIRIVSAADGKLVGEVKTDAPVVWDGMAAANGKLLISTVGGKVHCFGAR